MEEGDRHRQREAGLTRSGTSTGTVTYLNSSDTPSASTIFTVTVNDEGNSGNDPGLTGDATSEEGTNSVTINIAAMNDAPIVGAPAGPLAATEQTSLSIQGTGFGQNATVSIFDLNGRMVQSDQFDGDYTWDTATGNGVYFVVVSDELGNYETLELVKL